MWMKHIFFSYGSPLGDPLFTSNSDINPRLPGGGPIAKRNNAEASEDNPTVVLPGMCKKVRCNSFLSYLFPISSMQFICETFYEWFWNFCYAFEVQNNLGKKKQMNTHFLCP